MTEIIHFPKRTFRFCYASLHTRVQSKTKYPKEVKDDMISLLLTERNQNKQKLKKITRTQ